MLLAFPSKHHIIRIKEIKNKKKNKGFQVPRPSGGNSDLTHKSTTYTLHNIAPETKKQLQPLFLRFLCKLPPLGMQIAGPSLQKALCSSLQSNSSNQFLFFFLAERLQMHVSCEGQQQLPLATAWAPRPLPGTQLLAFFSFSSQRSPLGCLKRQINSCSDNTSAVYSCNGCTPVTNEMLRKGPMVK